MAKKRVYRRTEKSKNFRKPKNKQLALKHLEKTGELIDYLSPSMVKPRLEMQQRRVMKLDKIIEVLEENNYDKEVIDRFKNHRKKAIDRFIKLTFPILHSLIKKYSINGLNDDLKNIAIIDIIDKIFVKKKYDPSRASITSYVYEIAKQTMLRFFSNEITLNKSNVRLLIQELD